MYALQVKNIDCPRAPGTIARGAADYTRGPAIVGRGEADDIPGRLIENLDTLWGAKLSRIRRFSSAVRALASMTSVAKPISSLTLKANTPRLVVRVALISPKVEVESAIDRALEWVSIALSQ